MSYNTTVYDENYYRTYNGGCYERGNGWEEIFAGQAERIVKELAPKKTLDVGCAVGYLVESLRDRGVDAWGIDISEYAISQVRDDIKPYCKVSSATNAINEKYDLITCIEVLEHLKPEEFNKVVENICKATDMVLFSSSPSCYDEESHYSVNNAGFWGRIFAYNGFYHDVDYDASYFAVQTRLYRRKKVNIADIVYSYENRMFELWNENVSLRYKVNLSQARIADLDRGNIAHAQEVYNLNEAIKKIESEKNYLIEKANAERDNAIAEVNAQKEAAITEAKLEIDNAIAEKNLILTEKKQAEEALKLRHVELMREEYEKRDMMENKLLVLKNHQKFLESELWKAQGHGNIKNNNMNETYAEISLRNMENSLSWRITKPLRVIDSFIRRKK